MSRTLIFIIFWTLSAAACKGSTYYVIERFLVGCSHSLCSSLGLK